MSLSDPFEVSDSPAGNYLSARVAEAEHDSFAASTFARETLRADPQNLELIERAFVATLLNGDMPDCFALAQKLVARDQKNGTARLALAVRDIKARNFASARKQLNSGGNLRQRDLTAILLDSWTYVGGGDSKRGLAIVDTLTESNLAVFRDFHAGLMLDVSGNVEEAGKRFAAAYAVDQNTLRLVDAYARNLSRQGKTEEAKAAYTAYLKIQPRQPMVKAALRDLEAGRKLDPLVKDVSGGAAEVLYGLGAYGLGSSGGRQGDEVAATVFLRLALALAPTHELAIDTLGEAYSRLKQYRTAIEVYDETPENGPMRTTADIHIALLLDAIGKPDEALARLRKITEAHPDNPEAQSALADLLRNKKKYLEAADAYTRVIDLSPPGEKGLWAVYYFRGISYERAKVWNKAEPDFKKALELYPEQPLVLNYLGYSWVDQGVHLDEAFKMLRRAVELQPEDGYIVDSLGWAHYRLGHYDDAVKLLERAIELKPGDPTINDHLGDAYWQAGRKLDAQFQWNHARDLNPEPDDLPKILGKIANGLTEPKQPTAEQKIEAPPAAPPRNGG
ncbi:tetratricopeptide (TPR) repeat protein [Rhodoblastus acidophilus]|uniref:tetratricopeptide repeat protein n=1 Tax=Rhodoblastus acidophilus TaxID=1074 RepID=UPI002224B69F|nr:tetratricopeptide repeat protein [Rhodoblastus acidophilus]MCW2286596.1 tetratricopeptide (TPR) repeat protein [Rhodoblastus acidophilus]MCW2335434.1 tetratricopeptide (TPR) repeat protein [Rhodoblastus acidophilus]